MANIQSVSTEKTILHLSDLHFGAMQVPRSTEGILAEIERRRPTVVAISGDLTQRARTHQFQQAREFIERIPVPVVVVPGNHDVPLWNVVERFSAPLKRFRRWITNDPYPQYLDEEIAVLGLDSTRSFTIKGGKLTSKRLGVLKDRICDLPNRICKVVVVHHPIARTTGFEDETARGVELALDLFQSCGVELVLTGHLHESHVSQLQSQHPNRRGAILLVQAGTAASMRGRGSERLKNSFNLIGVTDAEIEVGTFLYSDERAAFVPTASRSWPRVQY